MPRKQTLVRLIIFIASIPLLALVITLKEQNWLYYTSLGLILSGALYTQYQDWQNGKQEQVKKRLITYGIIIAICVLLSVLIKK